MTWDAIELHTDRILHRCHEKRRRLALGRRSQVAPHRHALRVTDPGRHAIAWRTGTTSKSRPAEHPHDHARASGHIGFPGAARVPD